MQRELLFHFGVGTIVTVILFTYCLLVSLPVKLLLLLLFRCLLFRVTLKFFFFFFFYVSSRNSNSHNILDIDTIYIEFFNR